MAENNFEIVHTTPPVYVIPTAIDPAPRKFKRSCVTVYFGETMLFDYVDPEFNTLSDEVFDGTMDSATRIAFDCVQAYKFPRCSLDLWFAGANTAKFTVELSDYERILGANRKEVTWTRWADGWTFADFEQGAILNGLPAPSKNQGTYVDNKGDNYVPDDGSKASLLIKRSQLVDNYAALPDKSVLEQKVTAANNKLQVAINSVKYKYYKNEFIKTKEAEYFNLWEKVYAGSEYPIQKMSKMYSVRESYLTAFVASWKKYAVALCRVKNEYLKTTDQVTWNQFNNEMNNAKLELDTLKVDGNNILAGLTQNEITCAKLIMTGYINDATALLSIIIDGYNSYGFTPSADMEYQLDWFNTVYLGTGSSFPQYVSKYDALDSYMGSFYMQIPWFNRVDAYGTVMSNTYADTKSSSYPFAFRYWAANSQSAGWTQERHDKIRMLVRLIDQYYGQCVSFDDMSRYYVDPLVTTYLKQNSINSTASYEAKITSLIDEISLLIPTGTAGSTTAQIKTNITTCWTKWKNSKRYETVGWETSFSDKRIGNYLLLVPYGFSTEFPTAFDSYTGLGQEVYVQRSVASVNTLAVAAQKNNSAYQTAQAELTTATKNLNAKNSYESQIYAIDAQIVVIDSSYIADPLP